MQKEVCNMSQKRLMFVLHSVPIGFTRAKQSSIIIISSTLPHNLPNLGRHIIIHYFFSKKNINLFHPS